VISVAAGEGDRITAGDLITLADMSQPMVEISLDEGDYNRVQAGYKVNIVFDATPQTTLTGEVVQVYPSLSSESAQSSLPGMPPDVVLIQDMAGSTRALVRLDGWPPTSVSILPLGLTAAVEVISAQASDALLVPVVALHELDSGGFAVYVVSGDELELRPVTVGLQDYTSAQILDGLEAGEAVSLDEPPALEGEQ
jgi:cobalt-zinc-cadmium efflux system membrane fusion protein